MYLYNRKWLASWLRWTTPKEAQFYDMASSRASRDKLRKANLTSIIAPFVLLAPLLLLQQAQNNFFILIPMFFLMVLSLVALILNRAGAQGAAALLLILAMDAAIEAAIVLAGSLSAGWLLSFDLFVIPLAASAILLARRYVWIFFVLHIALILGDFYLMPHATDLVALIQLWDGPTIAYARPVIIEVFITLLSFLQVSSTDEAIDRADKAEELAKLQEAQARNKQKLEDGIHEILQAILLAEKGTIPQQITLSKDNTLWRIGNALETLFKRLKASKQAETQALLAGLDAERLAEALRRRREGKQTVVAPLLESPILIPVLQELQHWQLFDSVTTGPASQPLLYKETQRYQPQPKTHQSDTNPYQ